METKTPTLKGQETDPPALETRALGLAEYGSLANLNALLSTQEGRAAAYSARDTERGTPLLVALEFGRLEHAEALLPHSDLTATNADGETVWMLTVERWGVERVVEIAEKIGAQTNAQDNRGNTALILAVATNRPDRPEMVKAILPFVNAKIAGHSPLSNGEESKNTGKTALMFAAWTGKPKSLEALLPVSDLMAQEAMTGESALSNAIRGRDAECTRILLDQDHSAAPAGFWNPVLRAALGGEPDVLERVLRRIERHEDAAWVAVMLEGKFSHDGPSTPEFDARLDLLAACVEANQPEALKPALRASFRASPARFPRFQAVIEARELAELAGIDATMKGPGISRASVAEGPPAGDKDQENEKRSARRL